jgi:hypothetical protein
MTTLTTQRVLNTSPRKRSVTVVGLLDGQAKRVRRAVGDRLKFHFLPAGRRPRILAGCDEVILMTKFIGHDWQREAHAAYPRKAVRLHHGGVSRLIRLLKNLADGAA